MTPFQFIILHLQGSEPCELAAEQGGLIVELLMVMAGLRNAWQSSLVAAKLLVTSVL